MRANHGVEKSGEIWEEEETPKGGKLGNKFEIVNQNSKGDRYAKAKAKGTDANQSTVIRFSNISGTLVDFLNEFFMSRRNTRSNVGLPAVVLRDRILGYL